MMLMSVVSRLRLKQLHGMRASHSPTRHPLVPPAVEQCEPSVPSMPQLLDRLNTNNDFGAFVRAMRAGFVALC